MTDQQIIETLATKVCGWKFGTRDECSPKYRDGWLGKVWWLDGLPYEKPPNYLADPVASKQLRQKLAERFGWHVSWMPTLKLFRCSVYPQNLGDTVEVEAETEERAVALCALKAVGVDPTPSPQ